MEVSASKSTFGVLLTVMVCLILQTSSSAGLPTEVFGDEGGQVDLRCDPVFDDSKRLFWEVVQGTAGNIQILVKEPGKEAETLETRYAGRLILYDGNSLRISNLNRDDDSVTSTDRDVLGTYRCSQGTAGTELILRVRHGPAPPTDLTVTATKLYSVTVNVKGGQDGLLPQTLCLWYREEGTGEWKMGKGQNSCGNEVKEGQEITLESTLPASNTTYQVCVVAMNRLNSSRCEDAYVPATTDTKIHQCVKKPSATLANSEELGMCRLINNYVLTTTDNVAAFNSTIRLPTESFKSSDPNSQQNSGLVSRIVNSVDLALKSAHPDIEVEVVQFREGSVLADLKISAGQREIQDVKEDFMSTVRSGRLTGIDVDRNYLYIDNEIPRAEIQDTGSKDDPDIIAKVVTPIAVLAAAAIAAVTAVYLCQRNSRSEGQKHIFEVTYMAVAQVLQDLFQLAKDDDKFSILHSSKEMAISNVRKPDNGFHESVDCKNIVEKADEANSLVVCGSTGSGKTQGVLAYAKKFAEKTANAAMWFFGQSENEENGLSEKIIMEQGKSLAERLGVGKVSPEELPNSIMASLCSRESLSLLIFDDVTDPNAIPPAYLSALDKVKVIITTRSSNLDLNLPDYKMKGFEEKDVLQFLRRDDQRSVEIFQGTPDKHLLELSDYFGNYPHGLSLARAYLLKSRTSVESYLRELQERAKNIPGQLKMHEKAVYGAILMSMEDRMDRASQDMFKFAAILSQDRIPVSILSKGLEIASGENSNKDDFVTEVEELSLARVEGKKEEWVDGRIISVHQQTQAAIMSSLDEQQLQTMTESLIKVFLQYFHKDTRKVQDGYISNLLLPHVEAVLSLPIISTLPEEFHPALARLYETIGYMYCQKHLPEVAAPALEKAKEMISSLVNMDADEETVFQLLGAKGRELHEKEDVYSKALKTRLLTKGDIKVLKSKVPTLNEEFSKAAKMEQPLTEEQHQQLVELGLAYNTEQVRDTFLVELAATIHYTSGRRIFYFQGQQRVAYRQTAEKELNLSLALSQKLASGKGIQLLVKMLSQRAGTLYLLKETEGKAASQQKDDFLQAIQGYQDLINDNNDYFENGVLKKIGDDDWHRMFCYRAIVDSYCHLTSLATADEERVDCIHRHDESAKKMVEFAEQQVKKDDKGNVMEEPEMLPEVYNMSGDFIIEMIEKGIMKQLNDKESTAEAKKWYEKALNVRSIQAKHEVISHLGLAKVHTLMYESEKTSAARNGHSAPTANGETWIAVDDDDKLPLVDKSPTLDEVHHLINAKEEMNKSLKIFEEKLKNKTKEIQEARKWNNRIVQHIESLPDVTTEQESTV